MHKSYGADKILDVGKFNQDEIIGLGLSDESYLKQVAQKLKDEKTTLLCIYDYVDKSRPF